MPNLLLLSNNQNFANDLTTQFNLYLPEFNVYIDDETTFTTPGQKEIIIDNIFFIFTPP